MPQPIRIADHPSPGRGSHREARLQVRRARAAISGLAAAVACLIAPATPTAARTPADAPVIAARGARPAAFVPAGWSAIDTAWGDLNGDGLRDCALIIQRDERPSPDDDADGRPRILLALLGEAGGYTLSARADSLVLTETEGGVMGDPLQDLTIERGCIVISFWGGSREKWNVTYRFRFQEGDWRMIGVSGGDSDPTRASSYDFNLMTSRVVVNFTDLEHPKTNRAYTRRLKLSPLPRMVTFRPWTITLNDDVSF